MSHSFTSLIYHIVFSTKERRPLLDNEMRPRLFEYLGGAIRSEGGTPILINGVSDHLHILAKLRQDKALSDVIRNIKANSSGWIHLHYPLLRELAWQEGYAAFTVSRSQESRVKTYIANQEKHHKRKTFQEELLSLLEKHEIEYDPRYIWT